MSKKYHELKNKTNAIETTIFCILDEIIEIEDAIDNDLYTEEEIEECIEEINKLNDMIDYLRKLRDEYYLWSLEYTFEKDDE